MRIGIYAGNSLPIHAGSLEERPLGGTETGVIRVAEELTRRGYEVEVFTSHQSPPPSNPRYRRAQEIFNAAPFEVVVLVQEWRGAFFNLPTSRVWVWTGDGAEQYSNVGIGDARAVARIERMLLVSEHHRKSLCEASGFPAHKVTVVGNGVHPPYFEGSEARSRHRIIFTSAPYRGLALVPQILLAVQERVPDAEFHCFSGMNIYDRETPFEGPQVALYRRVAGVLQKIPHVYLHGNVAQRVLAREYMKSAVFLYPNTVPETCCITAMEAQAAGCALVTSSLGALPETVAATGVVVPETPGTKEFLAASADAVVRLLTDDAQWQAHSNASYERIRTQGTWHHVVDRIEQAVRLK